MDSYKKIRYSDFIYMLRMREDKNFLSEGVREQVVLRKKTSDGQIPDAVSPEILAIKDRLYDVLVPLEFKITKSKDSERNVSRFFLFCKENLRIYNNIDEYIKDAQLIRINCDRLEKDINSLMNHAISHVVTNDFSDNITDTQMFEPVKLSDFDTDSVFQPEPISGIFH